MAEKMIARIGTVTVGQILKCAVSGLVASARDSVAAGMPGSEVSETSVARTGGRVLSSPCNALSRVMAR